MDHQVALVSISVAAASTFVYRRYFSSSHTSLAQEELADLSPYESLRARSLLDNHDLTLVEHHLCALRFVLPNFHMERNMPDFRIQMAKIESAVIYLAKTGVKHVALRMNEALQISLRAETNGKNVRRDFLAIISREFQIEIRRCRNWIALMIETTKEVLENYQTVLAFIIHEAHPYSPENHTKVPIYDLLKGRQRHNPVRVKMVMDLGWKGYLVNSGNLLLKDRGVLLDALDRMFRFAHALSNMIPRNLKETLHPCHRDWEKQDRTILCRSIEIAESEEGLIWIMATNSLGGRGEEPGPRYLSWYNSIDASDAFMDVHNNEVAMSEAVEASVVEDRDQKGAAVYAALSGEADTDKKRHREPIDKVLIERDGDEESEEEMEARAQGAKRQRFTTYYNEEWPIHGVQAGVVR